MSEELVTAQSTKKVILVAPTTISRNSFEAGKGYATSSVKFFTLKHPRTKLPALYGVATTRDKVVDETSNVHNGDSCISTQDNEKTQFLEVQSIDEEFGSWAVGESIVGGQKSPLHMCTPSDPLLIVIPYLIAAAGKGSLVPLDDLVDEALAKENSETSKTSEVNYFANYSNILKLSMVCSRLGNIADSVGSQDLNVWRWNEAKALSFLTKKVRRLQTSLQTNQRSIAQDGSLAMGLSIKGSKRVEPEGSNSSYLQLAWEILSDYLLDDLSLKLAKCLGLNLEEPQRPVSAKKPKLGGTIPTTPLDDYTKDKKAVSTVKVKAPSAKEKACARAATGTKSIASFFHKR